MPPTAHATMTMPELVISTQTHPYSHASSFVPLEDGRVFHAAGSVCNFSEDGGRVEINAWTGLALRVFGGKEEIADFLFTGDGVSVDENFIDAICGRAEPRTTPEHGVVQSLLLDAIYESARTGRPVRLPDAVRLND